MTGNSTLDGACFAGQTLIRLDAWRADRAWRAVEPRTTSRPPCVRRVIS